jgi:endonuclease/exonuclease/phosphatase family metal-dependent hydrolase
LIDYLKQRVPPEAPLILGGDFNDWQNRAGAVLYAGLGLVEAFEALGRAPARSYPSHWPVLRLDRIYVRGFGITGVRAHSGPPWSQISDHAALSADLVWS